MRSVIGIFLLLIPFCGIAQEAPRAWLSTGPSLLSYTGDLNHYQQVNAGYSLGILLNRKEKWNGRINLSFGRLNGEDRLLNIPPGTLAPNDYFRTSFFALNYSLHYNMVKTDTWQVYLSQGIGIFRFTPKNADGEDLSEKPDTRAPGETFRNLTVMLPTMAGAGYTFPTGFGAGLETGWYNVLSDYLDNVSELGENGTDNIFSVRISLLVPLDLLFPDHPAQSSGQAVHTTPPRTSW